MFELCATSDTIFSIYERLPVPNVERRSATSSSNRWGLEIAPGRGHLCEVTLDAGRGAAEWWVDGHLVYDVRGVEIPTRLNAGLGLITLHSIVDGKSRSLRGQGLSASFGPISVNVSE